MTLARSLEALHRHFLQVWMKSAGQVGLSYSEFEYLRAVDAQMQDPGDDDSHGQHLTEIVATMGVQKASASAMVIKLEKRGLVERVPCQFDARAQHILLTADGEKLLASGRMLYADIAKRLCANVGDEDLRTVERALAAFVGKD